MAGLLRRAGWCLSKETWYWDASNVTEMVLSGVKCVGHEMTLSHCQRHDTVSCQKTGPRFAAGVICSESEPSGGPARGLGPSPEEAWLPLPSLP